MKSLDIAVVELERRSAKIKEQAAEIERLRSSVEWLRGMLLKGLGIHQEKRVELFEEIDRLKAALGEGARDE